MRVFRGVFLLGAFAVLFTSCRHDEDDVVPSKDMAVSFRFTSAGSQGSSSDHNTRAETPLKDVHQDFKVWAFKTMGWDDVNKTFTLPQVVMDQYIVKYVAGTAGSTVTNLQGWEYVGVQNNVGGQAFVQSVKYWDLDASSYRYFGFAPSNPEKVTYDVNPYGDEYDITVREVDATDPENTAPYISKFWFSDGAFGSGYPAFGSVVALQFVKPVTKVKIKILKADGTEITNPTDEGITTMLFAPNGGGKIVQKGNLKISYPIHGNVTYAQYLPKLMIDGDPLGSIDMDFEDAAHKTGDDWTNYTVSYFVLPHVLQSDFMMSLTIGASTKIARVPSEYMSWLPNTEYTYVFKLTDSDLQFIDIVQIGVTEWEVDSSTHEIFNW